MFGPSDGSLFAWITMAISLIMMPIINNWLSSIRENKKFKNDLELLQTKYMNDMKSSQLNHQIDQEKKRFDYENQMLLKDKDHQYSIETKKDDLKNKITLKLAEDIMQSGLGFSEANMLKKSNVDQMFNVLGLSEIKTSNNQVISPSQTTEIEVNSE